MSDSSLARAQQLVTRLTAKGLTITTVESCTGGALANAITNIPGSGDVFKDGFVVYSNEAKLALGVPEKIILDHTVYSLPTATALAKAGMERSAFDPHISIGITGSLNRADPDNIEASTVGEVYIAILYPGVTELQEKLIVPSALSRTEAKTFVVNAVFDRLLKMLQ